MCHVHKSASFKCVRPSKSPSFSTGGKDKGAFSKLVRRLEELEKENATLKGDGVGGPPQSDTTNEPAELREEIDALAKHIKWLESIKGEWAKAALAAVQSQLEVARAKLHENKPLGAKLSVLSRRVEQARKQKEKAIADRA
eukprot:7864577-Pyramimonas_sp.AAC.1